jgi:hypothetical protein
VAEQARDQIAKLSDAIVKTRQKICAGRNIGLTALYNLVDDGAYADVRVMHRQLDEAIAAAYEWPKAVAHDAVDAVNSADGRSDETASESSPS